MYGSSASKKARPLDRESFHPSGWKPAMPSFDTYFGDVWITRLLIERGMAAVYLVAFLAVIRQFKPLLGEHGLLPVPPYLKSTSWRESPGIFRWHYSDRFLSVVAWTGLLLSLLELTGLPERAPIWVGMSSWLLLYALYLSIVNVGQKFYAFGWESMLLEAGFFTAFLGPARIDPSIIPILILRWMLFRTEVGAGLIKLRHDPCWRTLTCLYYHYETQPLPNPLSWYFHFLPAPLHRSSALASHLIQMVVPLALFAPQPAAAIAGALVILHQLVLIVSGNYSWLNWLTVVLGFSAFDDSALSMLLPMRVPALAMRPMALDTVLWLLALATLLMSIRPALNLMSPHQAMNLSYNPLHLVGAYGAFGQVGRERYEIVIEGTGDRVLSPATEWREYGFRAKPGDPRRMPVQVAPYHLRLDWLIWFLPFSVIVSGEGIRVPGYSRWFLKFLERLLSADRGILGLMGTNPFPAQPPVYIRALFYQYRYATPEQRRETGAWWTRRLLGTYLPAVSLESLQAISSRSSVPV
jgi:hypothetical protein